MNGPPPGGLRWVQAGLEPGTHDLQGADNVSIATLRFAPKPAISWNYTDRRRARAEHGARHWDLRIERGGIAGMLGIRASVVLSGSNTGTLTAAAYFITGALELDNGHRYRWDGGMARSLSAFNDHDGTLLIRFDPGSLSDRVNTYLHVEPEAARLGDWPLLAILGLYLRLAMTKTFRQ